MKTLIIANWKMNPPTFREAKKLLEASKKAADKSPKATLVVAPPSIYFRDLRAKYRGKKLFFAVQSAHYDDGGAFTGEISMMQAKDAGASHVIIGHSERRAMGESNDDTTKKVAKALSFHMTPIFCVGETHRSAHGEHFTFVKDQLRAGFKDVPSAKVSRVVVAYEPVWAIGASAAMNPRDMHEMAIFIRKTIVEMHGSAGHNIKILYGGSIDDSNIKIMLDLGGVSGLIVGRASSVPAKITSLLQAIQK